MQLGLKLGSNDKNYTEDILSFFKNGYFQYIELFAAPDSFNKTIDYWKQFKIPFGIHAPHSFAGMNLSIPEDREKNKIMIQETFKFADALNGEYIIFHSGVNGRIEETVNQLKPFIDTRCLVENKPLIGLNGEKCLGATPEEIDCIINELHTGFCFDFGHAICTANTLKKRPLDYIKEFHKFNPCLYHLTDGDYASEKDTHLHYGKGTFPLNEILNMVPDGAKITNEAKHINNLNEFSEDCLYLMSNINLRKAEYSDIDILYEWANDPDTRRNSLNQEFIPYNVHKDWFKNKLSSDSVLFFIYHSELDNIGQVRLEVCGDTANISYSINPIFRGKKHGSKILQLIELRIKNEYPKINKLTATVRNENIASIKIFKKLNYIESVEMDITNLYKSL